MCYTCKNTRGAVAGIAHQIGPRALGSLLSAGCTTRAAPGWAHTYARRACCAALFGAIAAGAFLFVLRNSLGTWNVPNLLCRAKTPWSYRYDRSRACAESRCVNGKERSGSSRCAEMEGGSLKVGRDGHRLGRGREYDLRASSVRLLYSPFVHRFLRHRKPHAMLLWIRW